MSIAVCTVGMPQVELRRTVVAGILTVCDSRARLLHRRRLSRFDFAYTQESVEWLEEYIERHATLVYDGGPTAIDTTGQTDFERISIAGGLRLNSLAPGTYVLQITVKDKREAQRKHCNSSISKSCRSNAIRDQDSFTSP